MRKLGLSSLALLLLMTTTLVRAQKSSGSKQRPAAPQSPWVEQTLKKMSVREKLGQMLMIYYFGAFTSTESAEYKELLHQVEDNHIGGMIVGSSRGPSRHREKPGLRHRRHHQRASAPLENSAASWRRL